MMLDDARLASRFGLGVRPDRPGLNPLEQLDRYEPRPGALAAAPTRSVIAQGLADYLASTREARMANRGVPMTATMTDMPAGSDMKDALRESRRYAAQTARGQYQALVEARVNAALITPAPFVERMVHFWANHFAISADKLTTIGMGGLLEVEAIRPNVLGTFADMLIAVERHPAMLLYLDQAQSIGPDSRIGLAIASRGQRKVGLNENLAREILELHTLGVRTGYGQDDVTEFARALTGWTVAGLSRGPGQRLMPSGFESGNFVFIDAVHQPGERWILGRRYADAGETQGAAVLRDLAAHPATATHVATKLARHFGGDAAPPTLVERLRTSFASTGGDLRALYRTLVESPELITPQPLKFRSPWDWTIASLRATGQTRVDGQAVANMLNQLGQPVWRPVSPAGFDDSDATWAGPDALLRRVTMASRIAARADASIQPRALAAAVLPGGGGVATMRAIASAETPAEGVALMLVAPEFMRR